MVEEDVSSEDMREQKSSASACSASSDGREALISPGNAVVLCRWRRRLRVSCCRAESW